jgi:hypothetical protein
MKSKQVIYRWPWLAMIVMVAVVVAAQDGAPPPPLTSTQLARVRELVRVTQDQSTLLQARLGERQRALARLYAQFELEAKEAQTLQNEIIGLQRQLLANHHQMQLEVRKVVGKERFEILRRRLERVLTPSGTHPATTPPASRP